MSLNPRAQRTRNKLLSARTAILSTITREKSPLAGIPLGSVVPVIWQANQPVILISHLAEHTQNVLNNPAASLLFQDKTITANIQKQWRICAMGTLLPLDDTTSAQILPSYQSTFPDTVGYYEALNFHFFTLHCLQFRIIEGFGRAYWLSYAEIFANSID